MSLNKINIAIAGATGFVGLELIYYLSNHPNVKISYLCARKNIGVNIKKFDNRLKKNFPKISNLKDINWSKVDLLFLSLPNGEAQKITSLLYSNLYFLSLIFWENFFLTCYRIFLY